jgi:hypothetical protein
MDGGMEKRGDAAGAEREEGQADMWTVGGARRGSTRFEKQPGLVLERAVADQTPDACGGRNEEHLAVELSSGVVGRLRRWIGDLRLCSGAGDICN